MVDRLVAELPRAIIVANETHAEEVLRARLEADRRQVENGRRFGEGLEAEELAAKRKRAQKAVEEEGELYRARHDMELRRSIASSGLPFEIAATMPSITGGESLEPDSAIQETVPTATNSEGEDHAN
jgi:hypothetical protein